MVRIIIPTSLVVLIVMRLGPGGGSAGNLSHDRTAPLPGTDGIRWGMSGEGGTVQTELQVRDLGSVTLVVHPNASHVVVLDTETNRIIADIATGGTLARIVIRERAR